MPAADAPVDPVSVLPVAIADACRTAGADDVLFKPVEPPQLYAKLRRLLGANKPCKPR